MTPRLFLQNRHLFKSIDVCKQKLTGVLSTLQVQEACVSPQIPSENSGWGKYTPSDEVEWTSFINNTFWSSLRMIKLRTIIKNANPTMSGARKVVSIRIKRLSALVQTVNMKRKTKCKRWLCIRFVCLYCGDDYSTVKEIHDVQLQCLETKRQWLTVRVTWNWWPLSQINDGCKTSNSSDDNKFPRVYTGLMGLYNALKFISMVHSA